MVSPKPWKADWLPVLVAVVGMGAVALLWQALAGRERRSIQLATRSALERVHNQIETRLAARVLVLVRMARRWETRGRPPEDEWRADADLHVAHFGDFQRIEWITPTLEPGWSVPAAGLDGDSSATALKFPDDLLEQLRASGRSIAIVTRDSTWSPPQLEVYVPLSDRHGFDGFIRGTHHLARLLDTVLENVERGFGAAVYDGPQRLYMRGGPAGRPAAGFRQADMLAVEGLNWRVEAWPSAQTVAEHRTAVPLLFLAGGLVVNAAVAVALRYARLSRRRARELELTNRQLHEQIAERAQAEERARRHEAELAHVARLGTMGELAAGLAHELNQPLCAIVSNAQAAQRMLRAGAGDANAETSSLESTAGPDQVEEALADVVDDGRRAGEMIQRLRDLLRKRPIQLAPLAINTVVEEAARLIEFDARQHSAHVIFALQDGLPLVSGDRIHIQQILLNLARNGLEAMGTQDAASRRLIVRTGRDESGHVTVSVSDRGAGLPPELAERIFEPFFTTKPNGLGVGLAICRSIAAAHGGRLWFAPNPDGGTTWRFSIPPATTT